MFSSARKKGRVTAVALPAVGRAGLVVAGDHVAGAAIVAAAAAADVIENDAVADLEFLAVRADFYDLPARLVAAMVPGW